MGIGGPTRWLDEGLSRGKHRALPICRRFAAPDHGITLSYSGKWSIPSLHLPLGSLGLEGLYPELGRGLVSGAEGGVFRGHFPMCRQIVGVAGTVGQDK